MCLWGADYKRGIILFKIYKHMFYFFTQRKTPRTWCRVPAEYLRAAGKHTWLPPRSSPGPSAKTFPNPSGGSEVSQGELLPWAWPLGSSILFVAAHKQVHKGPAGGSLGRAGNRRARSQGQGLAGCITPQGFSSSPCQGSLSPLDQ